MGCYTATQDVIERLDIYRDCTGGGPPMHGEGNAYFGSMWGYQCLQEVCIQPEALLGDCCHGRMAPFQLKDTLPFNFKSLILYGDEGNLPQ